MSDYYHTFLSSVSGLGSDSQPSTYPHTSSPVPTSAAFSTDEGVASNPLQNATYYTGFTEPIIQYQPPKGQRSRRKSAPGPDHIKHRRTRSGCFTCRGRRVKCDETRPICERECPLSISLSAVLTVFFRMSEGQARLCVSGTLSNQEASYIATLERCGPESASKPDIFYRR